MFFSAERFFLLFRWTWRKLIQTNYEIIFHWTSFVKFLKFEWKTTRTRNLESARIFSLISHRPSPTWPRLECESAHRIDWPAHETFSCAAKRGWIRKWKEIYDTIFEKGGRFRANLQNHTIWTPSTWSKWRETFSDCSTRISPISCVAWGTTRIMRWD